MQFLKILRQIPYDIFSIYEFSIIKPVKNENNYAAIFHNFIFHVKRAALNSDGGGEELARLKRATDSTSRGAALVRLGRAPSVCSQRAAPRSQGLPL